MHVIPFFVLYVQIQVWFQFSCMETSDVDGIVNMYGIIIQH